MDRTDRELLRTGTKTKSRPDKLPNLFCTTTTPAKTLHKTWLYPSDLEVSQGPIQAPRAILYKKWSVRVRVDKECLGQSFAVEVHLLQDAQTTTPNEDDFAGDFWTFVDSRSRTCENCNAQREAGLTVEGYVDVDMDHI
jgi:hypothetical protein